MATENGTLADAVGTRLEKLLTEAGSKMEGMEKTLNDLSKPQYGQGVHIHRDGGGYSGWMPDDDTPTVTLRKGHPGLRPAPYADNYRPYQVWKTAGDFYKAVVNDGGKQTAEFCGSMKKAIQGMSEQIGSDGGFTVLPEFNKTILQKVYENNLFSMTDGYQVAGNNLTFLRNSETSRVTGSRHGGLAGYWLGEGSALTASKPGLGELSLKLHKLGVVVYLTQELIDDTGIALEQYVNRKVSDEFSFLLGDSIFEGDGVAKPYGFYASPASLSVAKETGQLAKTIVTENIDKMWARFFAGSVPNSVWFVNQDVWPALLGLVRVVGTGGVPVFVPPSGAAGAPYGTLMGRPVVPIEFASTLGTVGDIVLADLKQYVTITKGGVAQAQSMHVEFLTDQLALRFTMRVDGAPWETSPVTPFKGTNTQSSFVTLATRA